MKDWHFVRGNSRLGCRQGLHASVKPLDALEYAPGPIICRVKKSGEFINGTAKIEVLWSAEVHIIASSEVEA